MAGVFATRRLTNSSLCASSLPRLSASPPITSAPRWETTVVSRSSVLPGDRANVQNTAAFLPFIVGSWLIAATPHGAWPTTNSPWTHVPTMTMSASWIEPKSGCLTLAAIISPARRVLPVRLSISSAAFIPKMMPCPTCRAATSLAALQHLGRQLLAFAAASAHLARHADDRDGGGDRDDHDDHHDHPAGHVPRPEEEVEVGHDERPGGEQQPLGGRPVLVVDERQDHPRRRVGVDERRGQV